MISYNGLSIFPRYIEKLRSPQTFSKARIMLETRDLLRKNTQCQDTLNFAMEQ